MNAPTIENIEDAPNLWKLKDLFDIDEKEVIISFGDKIFVPQKKISADLLVHELVHCERQGFNRRQAERWWERYYADPAFRLEEEVLSYREQYRYCRRVYKDRNKLAKILWALSEELSGETYGKIIGRGEAMKLISKT